MSVEDKINSYNDLKRTYLRLYCDAGKGSYLNPGLIKLYDDCVKRIFMLENGLNLDYNNEERSDYDRK